MNGDTTDNLHENGFLTIRYDIVKKMCAKITNKKYLLIQTSNYNKNASPTRTISIQKPRKNPR